MIREIRLRNFRGYRNALLALEDLTFVVGEHGSGKSCLLDALLFLKECGYNSTPHRAVERRGGFEGVLPGTKRLGSGKETEVGIRISKTGERASWNLRWGEHKYSEKLCFPDKNVVSDSTEPGNVWKGPLHLRSFPPRSLCPCPILRCQHETVHGMVSQTLRGIQLFTCEGFDSVRVSVLLEQSPNANSLEGSCDALAVAIPEVGSVRWGNYVTLSCNGFMRRVDQLSSGTLCLLGTLLALNGAGPGDLVAIDGAGDGMSPKALVVVVEAALTAVRRGVQVILATASTEFLDHPGATGERIRFIKWGEGESRVYRVREEACKAVNETDTVGWMIRSNSLWLKDQPERVKGED